MAVKKSTRKPGAPKRRLHGKATPAGRKRGPKKRSSTSSNSKIATAAQAKIKKKKMEYRRKIQILRERLKILSKLSSSSVGKPKKRRQIQRSRRASALKKKSMKA